MSTALLHRAADRGVAVQACLAPYRSSFIH